MKPGGLMDSYCQLARKCIENYVREKTKIEPPADTPPTLINQKAGVFVSIHKKISKNGQPASPAGRRITDNELRGCIGTILSTKENIAQEIIDNAIAACSRDFRFPPVTADELENLEINVDILSPPESIEGLSALEPKKYGIIVKSSDGRTGLLLPDLPGINDATYQVAIARQKAGIAPDKPCYLYRFTVERHKE